MTDLCAAGTLTAKLLHMPRALHVDIEVINTINVLPQRYYSAMLELLLSLRQLSQERYGVVVETIALRALRRHLDEKDVRELGHLLTDPRTDDALIDWFLNEEYAFANVVRARLEAPRSEAQVPRSQ